MNAHPRQLHLAVNVVSDGMHPAAWQFPGSEPGWFVDPAFWADVARTAERGTLDAIFLADDLGLMPEPGGDLAEVPLALDPLVLLSVLASVTRHIGLVATVSTSFEEPFNVARRFASLDHLSRGRAAWNVVTSLNADAWSNFGHGDKGAELQPGRAERYRRAGEFIDVVRALWDSWADDAVVGDRRTGQFLRLGSVKRIDHRGPHFSVTGPLTLPRPPQGNPVLFQAGGSPSGLEMAARYADGVFASLGTLAEASAFSADLRAQAALYGRSPDEIRVLPGLCFVLGSTVAEARSRYRELNELAGDRRIVSLAAQLSVDPAVLDWDSPLPGSLLAEPYGAAASHGARAIVLAIARREPGLTVRQLLDRVMSWHRLVVGTPEQLADEIEEWFGAGVVDGFTLMPDVFPSGLELFVDHVVPLLRRRGLFRHEYRAATLRGHLGIPPRPGRRVAPAEYAS